MEKKNLQVRAQYIMYQTHTHTHKHIHTQYIYDKDCIYTQTHMSVYILRFQSHLKFLYAEYAKGLRGPGLVA